MQGWRSYLQLKAQSKAGLSAGLLIWALIAMFAAIATVCFVILSAFIWLADRYGELTASLAFGACFLLITIIAVISCAMAHRRTVERAKLELAARGNAPWLDPRLAGVTLQVGRAIGWRKLVPLLAVGILAAGIGMQWFGRTSYASTKPRLVA
jgi:Ca2+/Na+ antiporter